MILNTTTNSFERLRTPHSKFSHASLKKFILAENKKYIVAIFNIPDENKKILVENIYLHRTVRKNKVRLDVAFKIKDVSLRQRTNIWRMAAKRKYPVGIQDFAKIRLDGYVYVDKTPLIYKMITEGCPYFLSRPRRFGKSLLVSTLAAVFEGRRELFEAFTTEDGVEQPQLFIAQTTWRWERYPVLRFDFSAGRPETVEQLDTLVDAILERYEEEYGIQPKVPDTNVRFVNIIRAAHAQTGRQVVVLCDEYDNMMLHSIGDPALQAAVRQRFQNLFAPLKSEDAHLRFVFITGISKFSQMGVFSQLNQLKNISMMSAYEGICGISEQELTTTLRPDIEWMAGEKGQTYDETLTELKANYDGYHFGSKMTDVYNPFSLFNALDSGEVRDYWFASGTTRALINMLAQMPPVEMDEVEGTTCEAEDFDTEFDSYQNPLPVLYQSGYLTIKDYRPSRSQYVLGFPNQEVRRGFATCLYRYVTNTQAGNRNRSVFQNAYLDFRDEDDLSAFIHALQTFFAGVPYMLDDRDEHHFHAMLYTLFVSFGADVVAEELSAKGRADLTLKMPKGIYVMELKYDATADEALQQIADRGYARKYALDGRPVTCVGLAFSSTERNITEWKSVVADA